MIKNPGILLIMLLALLFTQCKRDALHTNPVITDLSDFESADGKVCLNIAGGKAPYKVVWSNGLTDSIAQGLHAGTYYITITDAKKQLCVDTIKVLQPSWPLCVDKDGYSYETAIFGDQIWMIENLRSTMDAEGSPIESIHLTAKDSLEHNYGRLYSWTVAMKGASEEYTQGICPDGWHIPTDKEWTTLIDNITSFDQEIPNLDAKLKLSYPGFFNGQLLNQDVSVSFWTSTQAGDNAWKRYFNKSLSKSFRYHEVKENAISVRCIKD